MARLYLDHNVSRRLAVLLRLQGHDVVSARDVGLTRLPDAAQFLEAARQNRTLVTHNRRDFTLLHDAWTTWPKAMGVDFPLHPGVLVPDNAREDVLSLALENALEARPAAQLPGNLLWWHHIEGWRRRVGYAWQPANV